MSFGGGPETVKELKKNGIEPVWCSVWLGTWSFPLDGGVVPQLKRHLDFCVANNVKPFVQVFYWGDEISPGAVDGSVVVKSGSGRSKSVGEYWALIKAVGRTVAEHEVESCHVSLETEWNKKGIPESPEGWDRMFRDSAFSLRKSSSKIKVVSAPGSWHDFGKLMSKFPGMVEVTDVWATQLLRSHPRSGKEDYLNAPDFIVGKLRELKQFGKPVMLSDFCFSTWFSNGEHPFTSGNEWMKDEQEAVFKRFVELVPEFKKLGLVGVISRSMVDIPDFALHNYHGYAERFWGVMRPDGSKKPAYDEYVKFAQLLSEPPADPHAECEKEIARLKAEIDILRAKVVELEPQVAGLRDIVSKALVLVSELQNLLK